MNLPKITYQASISNIVQQTNTIKKEKKLSTRFDEAQTVHGTLRIHAVIPISESQIITKPYSFSNRQCIEGLIPSNGTISIFNQVESGFVTIAYESSWWLACIVAKKHESNEFKVSFLHPKGPASCFYYPKPQLDILEVPAETLLKKVDPRTATGRMYTLTKEEMPSSSHILREKLNRK